MNKSTKQELSEILDARYGSCKSYDLQRGLFKCVICRQIVVRITDKYIVCSTFACPNRKPKNDLWLKIEDPKSIEMLEKSLIYHIMLISKTTQYPTMVNAYWNLTIGDLIKGAKI